MFHWLRRSILHPVCSSHRDEMIVARRFIAGKAYHSNFQSHRDDSSINAGYTFFSRPSGTERPLLEPHSLPGDESPGYFQRFLRNHNCPKINAYAAPGSSLQVCHNTFREFSASVPRDYYLAAPSGLLFPGIAHSEFHQPRAMPTRFEDRFLVLKAFVVFFRSVGSTLDSRVLS